MNRDEKIAKKNAEIYNDPQLNRVRRKERTVTDDDWIKALLQRGAFGTIATVAGEQPFMNAHNYVYDEARNCLYFHRNPVGRTSANLERNPRVCYQVAEMGRMYSGKSAQNFGVEYRSVIVFGTAHLVETEEAAHALRLLMEKYAPHLEFGVDYEGFNPHCPQDAAVYRVDIESWSGKANEVADDRPGLYDYQEKLDGKPRT
jgi:uncharacterized protein